MARRGAAVPFTAGAALLAWPRAWWVLAGVAVLVSMIAMVPSRTDARFGALVNLIVLVGAIFRALEQPAGRVR